MNKSQFLAVSHAGRKCNSSWLREPFDCQTSRLPKSSVDLRVSFPAALLAAVGRLVYLVDEGRFAQLQHFICGARGEEMHDPCNEPRPACLMVGAKSRPVVAVEVLVKEDVVSPMRVHLEQLRPTVDRP